GRSLNLRVIAEGVERQEELTFLQSHNCEEAQGYYFSRSVTPERLASLLEVGIAQAIIPFSPAVNGIHWPDFHL
ncbi:MAG: EAL domain-containing protein, partial [Bryobacteraceae bacterium]